MASTDASEQVRVLCWADGDLCWEDAVTVSSCFT